jgi:molybdopterin-guanine dinucleotide biosynthesis protein A
MQIAHNEKKGKLISGVTGVILAGGKSFRMGEDKANLPVNGKTLFSVNLDLLRMYFSRVIIAGDRPDLARPDVPYIPDIFPGSALGGLYTGLKSVDTDWIFVIPCDMPFPDGRILEQLHSMYQGTDAVIPETPKGYEPVFAFYHKNCLPTFERALQEGRKSIFSLYPKLNVRFLKWQDMPEGWEKSLLNVNTPEDLKKVKEGLL